MKKKLLSTLDREIPDTPPIWLMRQAGRYLPEYRALRASVGSFWDLSQTPKLAAEITLQPVERFGFDAAIVFSDIFVVPLALGIDVALVEGLGPKMRPVKAARELVNDEAKRRAALEPVYEAISLVRGRLAADKALIGFAGGAWTLATYLAEGQRSDDHQAAKLWGYREPEEFDALLERLAEAVAQHLAGQIAAGADVVQIFESWSQGLPPRVFERWVIAPTKIIVSYLRTKHPKAKIIGFPRATTLEGYKRYGQQTGVDAVSVDTACPIDWAVRELERVVQGNLDPIALLAGGAAQDAATDAILEATRGAPFVFNLGHGILPETPIAHVERLVARVRGG